MAFDPKAFLAQEEAPSKSTFDVKAFLSGSPTQLKASTQETLAAQEAARRAIIQRAQRPASERVMKAVTAVPGAVLDYGGRLLGGLLEAPTLGANPERIIPTLTEAARRTGIDIVQLGNMLLPKTQQDVLAMGMGPSAQILNAISKLAPRTPTEQEIQSELDISPLLGSQEEISKVRDIVPSRETPLPFGMEAAFEGAIPEVSESLAQAIQLASPIKGVQALKTIPKGIEGFGRSVRSAIKPTKGPIGKQLEKAANVEGPEIFLRNPNADKVADTAFEGFANEVSGAYREAGDRLSELRALSKSTLNGGDQIADKMEVKAVALERAGNKDIADELRAIAAQKRGTMTDVNSLQDAVTLANRKPNILRTKTDAEGFADEIISKEGGSLINEELATVGGADGAGARKQWSNLKLLNDNVQERLNKIINSAPVEAQPLLLETLASPEGVAGMFALVNGWTGAGALALGVKGLQKWAKNEVKNLKNSNTIIRRKYDELRKSPPPAPVRPAGALPPPIPQVSPEAPFLSSTQDALSEQISRQISGGNTPPPIPSFQIPLQDAFSRQFVPQRAIPGFNPIGGVSGLMDPSAQDLLNAAIAQSLSSGRNVPRIFLPKAP